jgi:hypothetical protein
MKHRLAQSLVLFGTCAAFGWIAFGRSPSDGLAQDKKAAPGAGASASIAHQEKIAGVPFVENRATADSAQELRDELLYHRATQTYLWALPLVSTLGMKTGSEKAFGSGYNVLPVWKKRLDAKTLVTTPNSDVVYAMNYVDLGKDGPLVMEAPPNLQGILLDFWQQPIPVDGGKYAGDVGFFGPDQGKGGKFLMLPPGYKGDVPAGHHVFRSGTNNVFIFLRAFYTDPNNLKPTIDFVEQTKVYPLQGEAKAMVFPDASGVPVNMLPISDGTAFDKLKTLVDAEGPHLADRDWMGMLAGLGIVKGEPFQPDERTRGILDRAAKAAYKMSRVIAFDEVVSGRSLRVYNDRRWINPMADATAEKPSGKLDLSWRRVDRGGALDVNCRPWFFSNYYAVSPGMLSQIPGKGAFYIMAFTDSEGAPLTGAANYKLTLPKDVPTANFWSLTLYEAENAASLANGQAFPSLGSRDNPVQNADGSTDIYLGPKAPAGQEKNWLATVPGRGYFAILRLYSPTEPALAKQWKPSDVVKVKRPQP